MFVVLNDLRKLNSTVPSFVRVAIESVQKRGGDFRQDIYLVGLFLNPKLKNAALSKLWKLEDVTMNILKLAKLWSFTKDEAILLKSSIPKYLSEEHPYDLKVPTLYNIGEQCQGFNKFKF
eukprot:Pompholyxophrys_punicea_v1_NODE_277_length_2406_cov_4.192684.p3 type:complete len:120 gc:universal NODE_277_length_2406_cov_4.192684:1541-1900(+)